MNQNRKVGTKNEEIDVNFSDKTVGKVQKWGKNWDHFIYWWFAHNIPYVSYIIFMANFQSFLVWKSNFDSFFPTFFDPWEKVGKNKTMKKDEVLRLI